MNSKNFLRRRNKYTVGFTLLELILVMAVISILSGLLIAVINPREIMAKGRDARRMTNLDVIHKAISLGLTEEEINLVATGSCSDCSSATGSQAVDGTGWVKFTIPTGKTGLSRYIPALPLDPKNSEGNIYTFGSTATSYELNAILEAEDNASIMSTDGGDDVNVYEVGTSLSIL